MAKTLHQTLQIILIWWFVAQDTFLIISVGNSAAFCDCCGAWFVWTLVFQEHAFMMKFRCFTKQKMFFCMLCRKYAVKMICSFGDLATVLHNSRHQHRHDCKWHGSSSKRSPCVRAWASPNQIQKLDGKRSADGRGGVKHLKENKDHCKCIVNA